LIVPVILSGGMGTRLWPISRKLQPKQLMGFGAERSLLQETAARLGGLHEADAPIVVCNEAHRFVVAEQLRELGCEGAAIVLEPTGRNTAPAIAIGALQALSHSEDAILLVMPADHQMSGLDRFHSAVTRGVALAKADKLVVFGIAPRGPETGYGYVRRGEDLGQDAYAVAEFVEKPTLETARRYLDSGAYAWNSGIFLFRARTYLDCLTAFEPEMARWCEAAFDGRSDSGDFIRLDEDSFSQCPSNSIDYAVMEQADNVAMVTLDCAWSDLGSWSAVWEASEKDGAGNALIGEVLAIDTTNTLVFSSERLVAAVGVDNLAIVETGDAVLVVSKDTDQDVKTLVSQMLERPEVDAHLTVRRPWGSFTRMGERAGFQVKRIVVKPGASLSLQKHQHRSEHWVVVRGTGRVTNDGAVFELGHSGHTYIPAGAVHRLENPGTEDLEIVEVQLGAYLGEDDIVRLEDRYGRG
jgi:mannose-1-phosphate guanylyltransferase